MSALTVVDTSVAFKWLREEGENGVDEARALLHAHQSRELLLVAPATLPVEIANALRYSTLTPHDVLDAIEAFDQLHVDLVPVDPTRLAGATSLAYTHGISVYDALFLALAEELDCPLVTADRRAFAGITATVEIRLI